MKKSFTFQLIIVGLFLITLDAICQAPDPIIYYNFNEGSGTSATSEFGEFPASLSEGAAFTNENPVNGNATNFGSNVLLGGTDEYIEADNTLSKILELETVTIMMWFNTNDMNAVQHMIWIGNFDGNGWGGDQELHISLNHFNENYQDGRISFFYGSGADTDLNVVNFMSNEVNISTGTWHHIAAVVNNLNGASYVDLYLDGNPVTPVDWLTTETGYFAADSAWEPIIRDTWDTNLRIGAGGDLESQRYFNGYVDDFKVFDAALSQEQIEAAMNLNETVNVNYTEQKKKISVYFDTSDKRIYIKNPAVNNTLIVSDLNGRVVLKEKNVNYLDVGHLNRGLYLVQLSNESLTTVETIIIR